MHDKRKCPLKVIVGPTWWWGRILIPCCGKLKVWSQSSDGAPGTDAAVTWETSAKQCLKKDILCLLSEVRYLKVNEESFFILLKRHIQGSWIARMLLFSWYAFLYSITFYILTIQKDKKYIFFSSGAIYPSQLFGMSLLLNIMRLCRVRLVVLKGPKRNMSFMQFLSVRL